MEVTHQSQWLLECDEGSMIKCLLANNDSVVDKFLSESVLELEYLENKVIKKIKMLFLIFVL